MIPWYLLRQYIGKNAKFTASCMALLICSLLFYNFLHVFLIVWAFLAGMMFTYSFVSPTSLLPNMLPIYSKCKVNAEDDELTLMKTLCAVCGLKKCPRHRPELNILAFQPWTNLNIRKSVEDSLCDFFKTVVDKFVLSWYRNLSNDDEFVDELRCNIRFLASVLLRRIKKVDAPKLVTERLLHAGMQHIDMCMQAHKQAGQKGDLQTVCLEHMGPYVHCAMWSRKAELEYLRRLVEALFPYILRPQALNSRSTCALVRELLAGSILLPAMDAVADPDLVNKLLLDFFDKTPPPEPTEPPSPLVPFLGTFSQTKAKKSADPTEQGSPKVPSLENPDQTKAKKSCLHLVLDDVINPSSPELLYPFMQFLKSEAAINVLQFCLACDDFNKRLLDPEASQSEFVELHKSAKELYNYYCAPNALDRIMFEQDIIDSLKEVVEGPPDQVIKLRTSTPLFKAYEHALNLLENNFLPLFHQSDDYYNMICGGRPNASLTKQIPSIFGGKHNCMRTNRKKDHFSHLRLKESADDQAMTGSNPDLTSMSANSSSSPNVAFPFGDKSMHDLSAWRVTIPEIRIREQENKKKVYYVFIVDVRRVAQVDVAQEGHWTVERRYKEFYALAQKLTEFHGEVLDCQLLSKRSPSDKNREFHKHKSSEFERYLQQLLEKPQLKSSELLYNFLTSPDEFSTSFLPDIKLGFKLKSKLLKEKGQHLDPFLVNFSQSTEAAKPKPSKTERRGSNASVQSTLSEKLMGSLFENNVDSDFQSPAASSGHCPKVLDVEGPFDSAVFVAKEVYGCPEWVHHLLLSARILFKNTVDAYMDQYIDLKFSQVTQEHRLVALINLLKDTLFSENDPPRTDEDKLACYEQVVKEFHEFIPDVVWRLVGEPIMDQGCHILLQIFQQPKLNKQLTYVFLDILIQELFPELSHSDGDKES